VTLPACLSSVVGTSHHPHIVPPRRRLCSPSCCPCSDVVWGACDGGSCSLGPQCRDSPWFWGALRARLTPGRLQVAVASNAFPSYYGGSSSHPKVFTRYPTADAAGVQSLAAAQQGVQALAESPECGSV